MTCDDVRELLMTVDAAAFADLDPHLRGCATCAALADRVRQAETVLADHVDGFVSGGDLDAQWAAAVRAAPRRPLERWAIGLALVLAAAATLLTVLPSEAPVEPPVAARSALASARHLRADFDAISVTGLDVDGLDRAAEDAKLSATLRSKSDALMRAAEALRAVAEDADEDVDVRLDGWRDLAALYGAMARALAHFQHPSYLSDGQHEVYDQGLGRRAATQAQLAVQALRAAADLARSEGLPDDAAELDAEADDLQDTWALVVGADQVRAAIDTLREALERCALDAAATEEIQIVLATAESELARNDPRSFTDVQTLLSSYLSAFANGCPD